MNNRDVIKLSSIVPINSQFCRSARIDLDEFSASNFVYSNTIDRFLNTLSDHQGGKSKQGAYTWTGPYGSGKSTLALSLLNALHGDKHQRAEATNSYPNATKEKLIKAFNAESKSWHAITIIGERVSLFELLKATCTREGIICSEKVTSGAELIASIEAYCTKLKDKAGLIIFLDEMGKLLEFAVSNHSEDNYLYQQLAEYASRSNGKFVFVGILHQSFQDYASTMLQNEKNEWEKVQGRFVDIALNPVTSEQLEIISKTISSTKIPTRNSVLNKSLLSHLQSLGQAPAADLNIFLDKCWPLNPLVSLCLGPISKRSYGQNQRSIFSFLNSGEPLGFADYLDNTKFVGDETKSYKLSNYWEYLRLNWFNLISASQDAHSFAIASDLFNQLEALRVKKTSLPNGLEDVVKTIHLINLTSRQSGLRTDVLSISIAMELDIDSTQQLLNLLVENSIISFRKFNSTYVLHEGSDFDIEIAISEQLAALGDLDLEELSNEFLPKSIVAKKHYLETGALRWATITMADQSKCEQIIKDFKPDNGSFCKFLLLSDGMDKSASYKKLTKFGCQLFIGPFGLNKRTLETLKEFDALNRIMDSRAELAKDRIARREVSERLMTRRSELESIISELLVSTTWLNLETGQPSNQKSLSRIASECADGIFNRGIKINNELVNRNKVSANGNRALRQLMYDILTNEGDQDLGYTKFPAERSVYETIIKHNGLHVKSGDRFKLLNPKNANTEMGSRLADLFAETIGFLKANKSRTVAFPEIYENVWLPQPYGIKRGICPLLSFLFLKAHSSELAYYRSEVFNTTIGEVDIDYLIRAPKYCGVRYLNMDGRTKEILSELASISARILDEPIASIEPLDVAKKLIAIFDASPKWPKRSAKVSDNAKRIRSLFSRASDPAQFTLVDLPNLFGEININDKKQRSNVCEKIYDGLIELRDYQNDFLKTLYNHLMTELGVLVINKGSLEEIKRRAEAIKKLAGDTRMDAFLTNIGYLNLNGDNIERIASFLVNKPAKNWIDNDVDRILVEVTKYARQFFNLETMSHIKGNKNYRKALSLITHDKSSDHGLIRDFAISENDFTEASTLLNDLKHSKYASRLKNKDQLVSLLLMLIEERTKNG